MSTLDINSNDKLALFHIFHLALYQVHRDLRARKSLHKTESILLARAGYRYKAKGEQMLQYSL